MRPCSKAIEPVFDSADLKEECPSKTRKWYGMHNYETRALARVASRGHTRTWEWVERRQAGSCERPPLRPRAGAGASAKSRCAYNTVEQHAPARPCRGRRSRSRCSCRTCARCGARARLRSRYQLRSRRLDPRPPGTVQSDARAYSQLKCTSTPLHHQNCRAQCSCAPRPQCRRSRLRYPSRVRRGSAPGYALNTASNTHHTKRGLCLFWIQNTIEIIL